MRKYSFHWLDGKVEEGLVVNQADAITRLGYGREALRAVDFIRDVTSRDPLGDYMRAPGPTEPIGFLRSFREAAETGWDTRPQIFLHHWNINRPVMTDEQLTEAREIGQLGLELRLNHHDATQEYYWQQIVKEMKPLTLGELVRQNLRD